MPLFQKRDPAKAHPAIVLSRQDADRELRDLQVAVSDALGTHGASAWEEGFRAAIRFARAQGATDLADDMEEALRVYDREVLGIDD